MKLLIDYRERSILPLIEKITQNYELTNLPVGDFLLIFDEYGVIIERKSVNDFLNSLKTNRLWDQLRRLLTPEILGHKIRRRALVIHGYIGDEIEISGFGWNHIMGAMMEIQYKYDIPVFHAENEEALIEFFRIFIKRELEGKNEGEIEKRWMKVPPKRVMSDEDWKIYALSSLPYIGEKLAKNLLEHFGSIEKIAKANIIELKKVEGIGDKKAKQIYKIFH